MASFADLKKHLLEGVSSRVEQHGFKYRKSGQHYVKAFSGGILSLHLAFINHDEDFDVTADVAVRHSAVEQIVNQAVAYLGDRQKARTFTVARNRGVFSGAARNDGRYPTTRMSLSWQMLFWQNSSMSACRFWTDTYRLRKPTRFFDGTMTDRD